MLNPDRTNHEAVINPIYLGQIIWDEGTPDICHRLRGNWVERSVQIALRRKAAEDGLTLSLPIPSGEAEPDEPMDDTLTVIDGATVHGFYIERHARVEPHERRPIIDSTAIMNTLEPRYGFFMNALGIVSHVDTGTGDPQAWQDLRAMTNKFLPWPPRAPEQSKIKLQPVNTLQRLRLGITLRAHTAKSER